MASVTLKVDQWSIIGTHNSIIIKELNICFDIGIISLESKQCNKVLISNGLPNHCQDYFKHFRECASLNPVYLVPPVLKPPLLQCAVAQFNMENGSTNAPTPPNFINIHALYADDYPHVFDNYKIYAYPMPYKIPTYGYTIVSDQKILFAYATSTTIEGVITHPDFLNAKVLMLECPHLDNKVSKFDASMLGTIHILDIVENYEVFANNKHIVLFGCSPRFSRNNLDSIISNVFSGLPDDFTKKVKILTN